MVDLFASQYGWTAEYITSLPIDVIEQLNHAILYRLRCSPVLRVQGSDVEPGTLAQRISQILDLEDKADG